MAEDDKYVPSNGNPQLDPSYVKSVVRSGSGAPSDFWAKNNQQFKDLAKKSEENQKSIADFNADQEASRAGLLNKKMVPEGLEVGDGGVLRNKGYNSTKGYLAKEVTKMQRAHITERTWGKYNRGKTLDMYGNPQATPTKKSDITASISPNYGTYKPKGNLMAGAAGSVAGGLAPWIGRFNPTACGPVLVSTFGHSGGVIQSNTQEAINNGLCINSTSHWT